MREARPDDKAFLVEMSRLASSLQGRPIPSADAPDVVALLPDPIERAVIAYGTDRQSLGAAWWYVHEPPLVLGATSQAAPELVVAVVAEARRKGIATALVEAVANRLAAEHDRLCLNVHLLNPAVHLYVQTGFRVAGHGRGIYGVAMVRDLRDMR